MTKPIKIYLGAPLFSQSEKIYNKFVKDMIGREFEKDVKIYLPQENEAINDKSSYANSEMIYNGDNNFLDSSDILIALLDGQTIDAGLASEIGRFAKTAETSGNKHILGLYTDSRQGSHSNSEKIKAIDKVAENQFHYLNLYTVGAIKRNGKIVTNLEDLFDEILKIKEKINNA